MSQPFQSPVLDRDVWKQEQELLSTASGLPTNLSLGLHRSRMRRFILLRHKDTSGISGTGVVAEGCQMTDGFCALRWMGENTSYVWYANIEKLMNVHGHHGQTEVQWLDV